MSELSGKTTVVVGASRGLGRGVATAFAEAGSTVVAVARDGAKLKELAESVGGIQTETADATDPAVAAKLLGEYQPDVLVLVAGAVPPMNPIHEQTWESFSANWQADVKIAFTWVGEALRKPLKPGSRVIIFSSGAALGTGSPLSGGYAGSKATQRFIAFYGQEEANRQELDLTITAVMPKLTPATDLGSIGVKGYAEYAGISQEAFVKQLGKPLTPEIAGAAMVQLAQAPKGSTAPGYLLTADGLRPA